MSWKRLFKQRFLKLELIGAVLNMVVRNFNSLNMDLKLMGISKFKYNPKKNLDLKLKRTFVNLSDMSVKILLHGIGGLIIVIVISLLKLQSEEDILKRLCLMSFQNILKNILRRNYFTITFLH